MTRRSFLIYGVLLLAWALILGWLTAEHFRIKRSARAALINRSKDISNTLGLVLRSQRRFGGIISKERLESALNELVRPGELNAIALLNAYGEVVASAGPIDLQSKSTTRPAEQWTAGSVTLMNLVDLGTNVAGTAEAPIVMRREDMFRSSETNRPAGPPPDRGPPPEFEPDGGSTTNLTAETRPGEPSPPRGRRGGPGRPHFARPFWMSETDYKAMIEKQGVHSLLLVLSTQPVTAASNHDLWLRSIIGVLATVSVLGSSLAWRTLSKSSDLQLRLVRTSQLNLHLKEMNLAAAGLAHETRNPLNIIRGLAQMISKQDDASAEIKKKSREIIDETDRVTAQLNEFINYSKPREVRRSPVALRTAIGEVARTLKFDLEEKNIHLQLSDRQQLTIEADEQSLRQALFNLILNAIQAADKGGEIEIVAEKDKNGEVLLEIRDNGPGVPPERRTEIFKPYFTTNEKGTGLGLAIVQQITLAHGWEIECLPNSPKGAIFRLSHLKPVGEHSTRTGVSLLSFF